MLETFDCPKCGGPVSYVPKQNFGAAETVRCIYCNSSLIVPDRLHGQPARIVPITINASGLKLGRSLWLLLGIPAFIVVVVVLILAGALAPIFYSINRTVKSDSEKPPPTRGVHLGGTADDSFARVALKFGSEGIGPGMFKDARSIAVDGAGRIYVGEYTGGRVQVFDPAGKFLTQWSVGDRKTLIRGLAANRKGVVYVVTGGAIKRYEGETGNTLGQLDYVDGFDDVAMAADGGLLAAWYRNRDDLVRFNSNGQVIKTIPAAISSTSGDSELNTRVAIDGAGNMYALGVFNEGVFKFSPDGKFINRFGDAGDQPGQFRAAGAIAVDGLGRIFVSDIKGVQVFDAGGRYLRTFSADGPASGMVFNDNNELFVVARKHVLKFIIKGD